MKLRAGDKVSYHLEAKDNDAVDGAQKGEIDPVTGRVRPTHR